MTVGWEEAAVIVGVVAAVSSALCLVALLRFQRAVAERQRDLDNQVSTLDDAVRTMEAFLSELHPSWGTAAGEEGDAEGAAVGEVPAEESLATEMEAQVAPELQAAIAAAAAVSLGTDVHLRSLKLVGPRAGVSAWTQQGRVLVQSSHNLQSRR